MHLFPVRQTTSAAKSTLNGKVSVHDPETRSSPSMIPSPQPLSSADSTCSRDTGSVSHLHLLSRLLPTNVFEILQERRQRRTRRTTCPSAARSPTPSVPPASNEDIAAIRLPHFKAGRLRKLSNRLLPRVQPARPRKIKSKQALNLQVGAAGTVVFRQGNPQSFMSYSTISGEYTPPSPYLLSDD